MANKEHLARLRDAIDKEDISIWNTWKQKNENLEIDISGSSLWNINLRRADLQGANLQGANLQDANLSDTNLSDANLRETSLIETSLFGANLSRANLSESNLVGSNLGGAKLKRANLSESILGFTNLVKTDLEGTDFYHSHFYNTILGRTDLSKCLNLDSVQVSAPCIIDFSTLQASKSLSITFLRKIGLPDNFIEYLPDFFDDNPIRLFPVFLSHNEEDKPFTRKLYEALINRNAQVWMDEKKIKPGDEILGSISKAINVYDKMILVCSQQSLNSWWVDQELDRIMEKERQYQKASGTKERLLIPIRIDDSILSWNDSKAASIRKYHIGDFTKWQDPSAFAKALDDLVAALNVDRPNGGIISQLKKD